MKIIFLVLLLLITARSQSQNLSDSTSERIFSKTNVKIHTLLFDTSETLLLEEIEIDTSFSPNISNDLIAERLGRLVRDVPLHFNSRVRQFIDFFGYDKKEFTLRVLKRKELYFPLFEKVLAEEGLPDELKYLSVIESALVTRARSKAGAVGLWQFMPFTGKQFGLTQNLYTDERMNPEKATRAACKYLKQLHKIFGDWELAIAAYNCGPGNIRKAMRRAEKKTFWEIYHKLPRETRGYLPQYVAVLYVLSYVGEYQLLQQYPDFHIPSAIVYINESIDLKKLGKAIRVCTEDLIKLNPSLRYSITPKGVKNYPLQIPLSRVVFFKKNKETLLKACKYTGKSLDEARYSGKSYYHIVRSGESLGLIAQRNGVKLSSLRAWNNIYHDRIYPGQKLVIYAAELAKKNTKQSATKRQAITSAKTSSGSTHIVKPGDTLWGIARLYPNMTTEKLKELNSLKSDRLSVGQELRVK